jgi:hypothetical protein
MLTFSKNILKNSDDEFWRRILTTNSDDEFWRQILMTNSDSEFWHQILTTNFDAQFWRRILTTNSDNEFWRWILATFVLQLLFTLTFWTFSEGHERTNSLTYWLTDKFWRKILTKSSDDKFWRPILTTNFDDKFWRQILVTFVLQLLFYFDFLNFFWGARTNLLTYWLTNPVGIQRNVERFTKNHKTRGWPNPIISFWSDMGTNGPSSIVSYRGATSRPTKVQIWPIYSPSNSIPPIYH